MVGDYLVRNMQRPSERAKTSGQFVHTINYLRAQVRETFMLTGGETYRRKKKKKKKKREEEGRKKKEKGGRNKKEQKKNNKNEEAACVYVSERERNGCETKTVSISPWTKCDGPYMMQWQLPKSRITQIRMVVAYSGTKIPKPHGFATTFVTCWRSASKAVSRQCSERICASIVPLTIE